MANSQETKEQMQLIKEMNETLEMRDARIVTLQSMYRIQGEALKNTPERVASLTMQCASLESQVARYVHDDSNISYRHGPSIWAILARRMTQARYRRTRDIKIKKEKKQGPFRGN
jgi:hypothetical protein